MRRWSLTYLLGLVVLAAAPGNLAAAKEPILRAVKYDGTTTYECRSEAIPINAGQNLNEFAVTKTCPHAQVVKGPGSTDVFNPGSSAKGYITRFQPSMVEIKPNGRLVTPAVWDLHLHHVVWLSPGQGPTFAAGEEKTIAKLPYGYGLEVGGYASWGLNHMIHNLTSSEGRNVYLTWRIDWVPETAPSYGEISPVNVRWLDVAGSPHVYPVFDAERKFDANGDGKFVFPDEVSADPADPSYEERSKISNQRSWQVPGGGAVLVSGAGHLHPGGESVDLYVARDGPDPGNVDGDEPSEVRDLFSSKARYYEPAGAVSWDVSMGATPRNWRIRLKGGDTVFINVTYDVKRASWYESMGILPVLWTKVGDPRAKDPFDDAVAVREMYESGGILTHGRLKENIDRKARKNLKLPDPRKLKRGRPVPKSGIKINSFVYSRGGFSAVRGFPKRLMRPPVINPGQTITFTNNDALASQPQAEQAWHSITSCRAPCNRGPGIGYPLANGPLEFDSGQLGYGSGLSTEVTTGSNTFTTPPASKRGKTYSYFCRIHPYMRGSFRVKGRKRS